MASDSVAPAACVTRREREEEGRREAREPWVEGVSAPERIKGKGKTVMMLDPKVMIPAPVESSSGGGGWRMCWRSMDVCFREGEVYAARNARRRVWWQGLVAGWWLRSVVARSARQRMSGRGD